MTPRTRETFTSDAVLLDLSEGSRRGQVLASAKHLTTADVTLGIQNAIKSVLTQAQSKSNIQALCIGTTVRFAWYTHQLAS